MNILKEFKGIENLKIGTYYGIDGEKGGYIKLTHHHKNVFKLSLPNTEIVLQCFDNKYYLSMAGFYKFVDSVYYKSIKSILDKFEAYKLIDTKEKMLEFCNEHGKYIDSKYYNLLDINECADYIEDCENNYCDKFMYRRNNLDYYDEDYYINYHFNAIGKDMFYNENFWEIIFKRNITVNDLLYSYFLKYSDFKDIICKFSKIENMYLLLDFIYKENEEYDNEDENVILEIKCFIQEFKQKLEFRKELEMELTKNNTTIKKKSKI